MKAARKQAVSQNKTVVPDRDQLMTDYLPHVKRIVNRMAIHLPATVDIEDLYNVGVYRLDPGRRPFRSPARQQVYHLCDTPHSRRRFKRIAFAGLFVTFQSAQNPRDGPHLCHAGTKTGP
jgi:hypothetical protein